MDHSRAPVTHSVWICLGSAGARIPRTWALAKTPIRSTKDDLVMDHIAPTTCNENFPYVHHELQSPLSPGQRRAMMRGLSHGWFQVGWWGMQDRDTYLSLCQGPDGWEGQQWTHASTPPRLHTLQTGITYMVSQHMQAHDHALYAAAFHTETHTHKLL